jgi:hypothetical protein
MNTQMPTTAAECRAQAVECGRWIASYMARGDTQKALQEIEWAKTLCLKAIKFEQEEQTSARGSTSNAEGAGGVSPPAPLASKSNSLSAPPKLCQTAASTQEAETHPVSGEPSHAKPSAEQDSTVGLAPSEQVEAPNLSGSAARGQAALSGECPEAPPVERSPQGTSGNSGTHIVMSHQDIRT